jgi:predicted glycosyltransferase involved in capsule biosynthesis
MKYLDLKNTTFIIPIKIEHPDRYRNAKTTLGFLNKHFKTNVFIYEVSEDGESKIDFKESLKNLSIKHWLAGNDEVFHRTKYLNIMLDSVKTKVVVNYDVDVILSPSNYIECQQSILNKESHVIYPYEFGLGQKMVFANINLDEFYNSGFDINYIDGRPDIFNLYGAEYGHCMFFNTNIYKNNGGENEQFISYGPEDKERGERFKRLGYVVNWKPGYHVYHFEHHRGNDSSPRNPHFDHNWEVYNNLNNLYERDSNEYSSYYKNPEYAKDYKTIGNN